jgi:large subunit ribosomal protein L7/L12
MPEEKKSTASPSSDKKESEVKTDKKEIKEKDNSQEEVKTETAAEDEVSVEVPKKFKPLVEEIEKMSVLDLAELVKILEKKFGVSAAAPAMMMAGGMLGANNAGGEKEEEKTIFDIELSEAGGNKIGVIKAIREITEMGLKDAKDFVDGAPKVLKEGIKKEEAEEIKKKLEEAGAKITLK